MKVRSYPKLGLAAVKAGEATQLRLWLTCRLLDAAGDRRVKVAELRAFCESNGVMSWGSLRRTLSRGREKWWSLPRRGAKGAGTVYPAGRPKVCRRLGVGSGGDRVDLELSDIQSMGAFRGALLRSFAEGKWISQRRLGELAGVTARSVRRYLAGMPRTRTAVQTSHRPQQLSHAMLRSGWCWDKLENGDLVTLRAMPNLYGEQEQGDAVLQSVGRTLRRVLFTAHHSGAAIARAIQGVRPGRSVFVMTGAKTMGKLQRAILHEWAWCEAVGRPVCSAAEVQL